MPAVNPSPFGVKPQIMLANGLPAVGALLFSYVAGSVGTKQTTFADSSGTVPNPNPITLNALGEVPNELWVSATQNYKFVFSPAGDTDPPSSPIFTVDNVPGAPSSNAVASEWVDSGLTPTFGSATTFSVPGNQTSIFQIQRRVKTTNAGGTIYSTITGSVFGAGVTTVTVANDAGVLDVGLSAVAYGFVSAINTSIPALVPIGAFTTITASGLITSTVGNSGTAFTDMSATTGFLQGGVFQNTAGFLSYGVSSSTGNSIFSNEPAYDSYITFQGTRGLSIGPAGGQPLSARFSGTGLAIPGIMSAGSFRDDAANLIISSTNPTIASGFGTGPAILANNTAAFKITVGSAPGNTGTLTMPTAPNGWICSVQKQVSGVVGQSVFQSAQTPTSVTFINRTTTTEVNANFTAGDVLLCQCTAF
jgi:hypothetical protein